MTFEQSTRLKVQPLPVMTRPTGGGQAFVDLPKSGIGAHLWLNISATVAGSLSAPNAYGLASIIRRITLKLNSGHNLIDISGAGYFYLMAKQIEDKRARVAYNDALLAVTTGTKNLDIILPIALNLRDEYGLVMLQNEATLATLTVDFESDAVVATGATVTATVRPFLVNFEVPANRENWPRFDNLHQYVEEQWAVAGSGDFDFQVQRGATVTGLYALIPAGYTNVQLIAQNTNVIESETPEAMRLRYNHIVGDDVLLAGAITGYNKRIFYDMSGSDGLGDYGTVRDVIDTRKLTSLIMRIAMVGATTLTVIRRQIVPLGL